MRFSRQPGLPDQSDLILKVDMTGSVANQSNTFGYTPVKVRSQRSRALAITDGYFNKNTINHGIRSLSNHLQPGVL